MINIDQTNNLFSNVASIVLSTNCKDYEMSQPMAILNSNNIEYNRDHALLSTTLNLIVSELTTGYSESIIDYKKYYVIYIPTSYTYYFFEQASV
jgi:hypothetical protein